VGGYRYTPTPIGVLEGKIKPLERMSTILHPYSLPRALAKALLELGRTDISTTLGV